MDTIILSVSFKGDNIIVPTKSYEVNIKLTMQKLKDIVVEDLENLRIQIPKEKLINYGFARIDSCSRPIYFLNGPTQAETLNNSSDTVVGNSLLFTYRCRLQFPHNIKGYNTAEINTPKYKHKFMKAIDHEDLAGMNKYLSMGLEPNFYIQDSLISPIYSWSLLKSCLQEPILDSLVENGFHLDYRNPLGECSIHLAISSENRLALKILHKKGVSFEEYDVNGIPALFYGFDKDMPLNFLRFLLELCNDVSVRDSLGNSCFHYCIKKGLANHLAVAIKYATEQMQKKELSELVSSQNSAGNTPIHLCVLENQKSCLEQLMRFEGSLIKKNLSGLTPFDLANKTNEFDIVKMLKNPLYTLAKEIDRPGKMLTYKQSLDQYRTYARSLRKPNYKFDPTTNLYPTMYKVNYPYEPSFKESLTLQQEDWVFVFLILKSKVAFGYKMFRQQKNYGWFPSHIIEMNNLKKIDYFQHKQATLDNLTNEIPPLTTSCSCTFFPIMLFLNLSSTEKTFGIEIAYKKIPIIGSFDSESLLTTVSPFFVRFVVQDSPADKADMRVGDRILYIMEHDVTLMKHKTVITIIEKMISMKVPTNSCMSTVRQICFIVLRHRDVFLFPPMETENLEPRLNTTNLIDEPSKQSLEHRIMVKTRSDYVGYKQSKSVISQTTCIKPIPAKSSQKIHIPSIFEHNLHQEKGFELSLLRKSSITSPSILFGHVNSGPKNRKAGQSSFIGSFPPPPQNAIFENNSNVDPDKESHESLLIDYLPPPLPSMLFE